MFKLKSHIKTGRNGGETLFFADVNQDGKKEIIIRQSGGFYDSKFYRDDLVKFTKYYESEQLTEENSMLLQLTCMTQEGEILWQRGKPWTDERPYISHASKNMTAAADLYKDGKMKVLYVLKDVLYMLDGATGELLRQVTLPTETISSILCQDLGNCYNILLKCDGESDYGYGKPLLAYDNMLNPLWQQTDLIGAGHNMIVSDVNGDGKEEILEGYNLLDHNGNILWSYEATSHADQIVADDINQDNRMEIIYCTDGLDFIVLDPEGNLIYKREDFEHPQQVSTGNFLPNGKGKQLFLNNKACDGGSFMLDASGNELWELPCNGYARTIRRKDGDLILFCPQPGRLPQEMQDDFAARAKNLGYDFLPITKEFGAEPFVLDGEGKIKYRFPKLDGEPDLEKWDLPRFIQNYFGAGFESLVNDVDQDGEDEIVIYNRENIWIYKSMEG